MDASAPSRSENNWYVITGGPGAGKSTLIHLLAERGYATAPEHARFYIDCELLSGRSMDEIRADQRTFQHAVLLLQMEHEENTARGQLTFFDRGIPDTLAYQRYYGLPEDPLILEALRHCSYRKVFILELLPLVPDYARTEDEEGQLAIQKLLIEVYQSLPFPIVRVPQMDAQERQEFVLANL